MLNLLYQKLVNLLDFDCEASQVINLELLLGVLEPLEKGDDSFLSFREVWLIFLLICSIMEIYGLTKRINNDYK